MDFPDLAPMPASVTQTVDALAASDCVQKALAQAQAEHDLRIKELIELTEVPAPPFHEDERAKKFAELLRAAGVQDVTIDEEGNVIGTVNPDNKGPHLVLGAHTDSVFAEGTDVTVKNDNGILRAPGISDDTAGLAGVLQVVRCIVKNKINLKGRLTIIGSVGEEGNGDLRGTKYFFKTHNDVDAFISLDGAACDRVLKGSTGSKRYRMVFTGPGGHSFGTFGKRASATHALCRLGAKIADIQVPTDPITTFTVGVISGGSSVNAIAARAEMQVDMRSQDNNELDRLVDKVLAMADEAVKEENARWGVTGQDAVTLEKIQIGARPAGMNKMDAPVILASRACMAKLGLELKRYSCASTDQNVPISLGIQATTLGTGGSEGNNHALNEWFDPTDAFIGPQLAFLVVATLLGVDGVTDALLTKRA